MVSDRPPKGAPAPSSSNGYNPVGPNGGVIRCQADGGGRSVHDGFATIRSGGGKRGRARSSPSVAAAGIESRPKTCPGCCGVGTQMEPLWEERNGAIESKVPLVTRRDPKIPWWEVATRRSRYRSCPAFSQASIVSALEQTVSDVTDKLERLASSPDLKIAEADELRRSAAILRKQSSAVSQSVSSGYFSLERQASCDSVSSATSTISNATHVSFNSNASRLPLHQHFPIDNNFATENDAQEAGKIKKRNWLRASFRRAFGRTGRKRNKSNTDDSPTLIPPSQRRDQSHSGTLPPMVSSQPSSNQQMHYHSCHSLLRSRQPPILESAKEYRNGGKDNHSEVINRLQRLLQEKDRSLTEAKLELGAAQGTAKMQTEVITRLQAEAVQLKEENKRLNSLVHSKFGAVSDVNIASCIENVSTLTLSNSNGIYATISHPKGKKMKLYVVENTDLESPFNASNKTLDFDEKSAILIGTLSVLPKTTWEELDNMVAQSFQDYCGQLDPGNGLGLVRESLLCYRVAEASRGDGLPKPDLLPYGYCVGNVEGIHAWLKGPLQKDTEFPHGNVSATAFQHSIPSATLKQLLSVIHETRRVVIVGPNACGKSSIAHQLARCFVLSKNLSIDDRTIVSFTVNGSNSLELCQLLSSLASRGRTISGSQSSLASEESSSGQTTEVLIINCLHTASGVVETLQRCLSPTVHRGPAIIATSQNAPMLITRLQVHCSFRWVGFSVQEEPIRGSLGRILRGPLLAAEIHSGMKLPLVHRTVDWLTRLWLHLNSLLSADSALGPLLLGDCPLDQEEAKSWFILKWNNVLVPALNELLKGGITIDPKEWVLSTLPWKEDDSFESLNSVKSISTSTLTTSSYFQSAMSQRMLQARTCEVNGNGVNQKQFADDNTHLPSNAEATTTLIKDNYNPLKVFDEDVIYAKPPIGNTNKGLLLGSFSTFIANEKIDRSKRVYQMQTFTPVLYRRENVTSNKKTLETNLDAQMNNVNNIKNNTINNNCNDVSSNKNLLVASNGLQSTLAL